MCPFDPKIWTKNSKISKKTRNQSIFFFRKKLKDIPCNHKSPLPKNSYPGIYEIECGCGVVYIGEPKKKISNQIKEHKRYVIKGNKNRCQKWQNIHQCMTNNIRSEGQTVCVQSNWKRRKIREALEI